MAGRHYFEALEQLPTSSKNDQSTGGLLMNRVKLSSEGKVLLYKQLSKPRLLSISTDTKNPQLMQTHGNSDLGNQPPSRQDKHMPIQQGYYPSTYGTPYGNSAARQPVWIDTDLEELLRETSISTEFAKPLPNLQDRRTNNSFSASFPAPISSLFKVVVPKPLSAMGFNTATAPPSSTLLPPSLNLRKRHHEPLTVPNRTPSTRRRSSTASTTMPPPPPPPPRRPIHPPSIRKDPNKPNRLENRDRSKQWTDKTAPHFAVPQTCEDSVLTYACPEVGDEETVGPLGIVRQVRGERPGDFSESEVLFAVRYVVGAGEL